MTPRSGSSVVTLGETMALASSSTALPHAAALELGIGGAESNVAIGVRRLGAAATWVGRVGDDPLGARVLRELRAEGVDLAAVRDPDAPTGLMVKERRSAVSSSVWYYRAGSAGSRLSPADLPPGLVAGADVLHLTGITPGLSASAAAAVDAALAEAVAAGVPVSFDVNHRDGVWRGRDPRASYASLARAASVVFAGEDETRLLTGTSATDPADLLDALAEASGGDAVLKLGERGCAAVVGGERLVVPAVAVPVVDTVGAGDAFVAGYLADLVAGLPAADRLRTAVRCGAFACTSPGDWEGLPTRDDLGLLDGGEAVRR
ncbi:sugar kinase [Nocardioides sp. Arc9.136]|uniref:sugar kinase n=1 Tax=Nocardioides sp. Arc9.136 TaxID=2996826 RepID=UPI0026671EFE|nr:sugar kinase [Nocardioides sp. Arc9.136]WKN48743.1 sugar kinase [Nocardioides sp. Arc9.136]